MRLLPEFAGFESDFAFFVVVVVFVVVYLVFASVLLHSQRFAKLALGSQTKHA